MSDTQAGHWLTVSPRFATVECAAIKHGETRRTYRVNAL
jgi:hypothetical protein